MILHFEKKQEKCLDSVNCNPTSSTNFPILLYRSKKNQWQKSLINATPEKNIIKGVVKLC